MPDRKSPPVIHDAVEFDYKLPPITQEALSNGLPLYWLNAGVQDVVEIDFVFPGGVWYEQKPAVANAVAGLLKNGTSKHTAHQLHETIEFYGASLKANTGNDFATVTLYSLTKYLPNLLPIVYEILTDAVFPETEIAIHKQNAVERLLINLRQCEFVANQKIDAMLFGEAHPYGRYSKKEKIEAIQREDLVLFYKDHFALANMKIFMAGNISKTEVKYIDEVFGVAEIKPAIITQQDFSAPPPNEIKQHVINDPNGVQGAVRIGRLFPTRHHPDFAPMVVLNTLFGGYFGSRLMSNIREEKGYTYGIYSSLSPNINGGSLIIHTEAGRAVLDETVKETYFEMERLCTEAPSKEELLLVKNYLLGGLLGDLDGPFSILQRWRALILNDFAEDYFYNSVNIYKTITSQEILALAQKYLNREAFHEVVVI